MEIDVYTLHAFAKEKHGGNPAGVVLHADGMTEKEMQKVAHMIGFSETAFVQKSSQADYKLRFFTPNSEVDVCGHATIATFHLMLSQNVIRCGTYTLETGAGILEVNIQEDGNVFLTQALPQFYEEVDKQEIANSLGISMGDFVEDLPVQVVSTGLRDILVPLKSIDALHQIHPDFNRIAHVSREYDAVGYHVFTLETKSNAIAQCRNFAPLVDIPEESATGTSTGALSCYLYKYGKFTDKQWYDLIFEQGYTMRRPSEIKVRLCIDVSKQIRKVEVGGMAVNKGLRKVKLSRFNGQ